MDLFFQIFFIFLLISLNGFFVASEFALVALRRTRVDELVKQGSKTAKLIQSAHRDLDTYISATQLGITLASLALGWIGEPTLAHLFEFFFHFIPENNTYITSHTLSAITAFILITFLHIVIGELAPKSIALQKSEKTALLIITPLVIFSTVFKPFIFILNEAGAIVLKIFGLHTAETAQTIYSEEEVKMILEQSKTGGTIPQDEVEMMYNVFRLGDIPIKRIMIPRTDIIAFPKEVTLKEVIKKIKESAYSRFPIYDGTIDNIIGFLHIKDIYRLLIEKKDDGKSIEKLNIIRNVISVPETKKADDVLLDMRKKSIHMAVVNDEYGGTEGIVTLEDVLENLVGEIEDEFDHPIQDMKKQPDGSYIIDGRVSIERVQRRFNLPLRGQGYATVGGLVFGLLGREPQVHDVVQIGDIIFEIEKMQKKQIREIKVKKETKKRKLSI